MKNLIGIFFVVLPMMAFADQRTDVVAAYADMVYSTYNEAYQGGLRIQQALNQLVDDPTEANLVNARKVWLAERDAYGRTEVYRFANGPIDDENGPEGSLNAWPLDEQYIDSVFGDANSGIINRIDLYPEISKELLRSLNEQDGEKNISTGYHAIEFLLWGQDLYPGGPGRRAYTDYVVGTGVNADRRGQYLKIVAEILVEDLKYVTEAWDKKVPTSYANTFIAPARVEQSLNDMLMGAYTLAANELSQERIYVAWYGQEQEDEHSCFSDNTHHDIQANYQGIVDVLRNGDNKNASLMSLFAATKSGSVAKLNNTIATLDAMVNEFVKDAENGMPFDQAIVDPAARLKVDAIRLGLEELGAEIKTAAQEINITVQ